MRSFASFLTVFGLAVFGTLVLRAETPKLRAPDTNRQHETIENVRQWAAVHLNENVACTQAAPAGTAKSMVVDFSASKHPGAATGVDVAGSVQSIFAVASAADIEFDHWGTLEGQRTAVYRYSYVVNGKTQAGFIFADESTGAIARMIMRVAPVPAHLFCVPQSR
jgi:hypothetical protein